MRVAVVTPAFNAAPYVGGAIRSVLAQTHADWHLVVVDDGSTDATAEQVAGFLDRRIRLVRQANRGVSAARNRGLAEVRADAVLFLDADDTLSSTALADLTATLATCPSAVAATGAAMFVAAAGDPIRRPLRPCCGDMLQRLLLRNRFANGGQLLIRRAAIEAAGEFDTRLVFGEDWEYWVRLAMQGPFAAIKQMAPVLRVQERAEGAYLRRAADPDAVRSCLDVLFANPDLRRRVPAERLAVLRRRAEAEHAWVVGRVLRRRGDMVQGRHWQLRSVTAAPSFRRAGLMVAWFALDLLPPRWRRTGPPVA